MSHRDAVSLRIADRHLRCFLARQPGVEPGDLSLLATPDGVSDFSAMTHRNQPFGRDVDEGWIANEEVLVARRCLHGLGDDANVLRAVVPNRTQIEIFEYAKHLKQHDAAARRLVGRDAEIAI